MATCLLNLVRIALVIPLIAAGIYLVEGGWPGKVDFAVMGGAAAILAALPEGALAWGIPLLIAAAFLMGLLGL
jgi:hypothetical protein